MLRRPIVMGLVAAWIGIGALVYLTRQTWENLARTSGGTVEIPIGPAGFGPFQPVDIETPDAVPYPITSVDYARYVDGYIEGYSDQRWWKGG